MTGQSVKALQARAQHAISHVILLSASLLLLGCLSAAYTYPAELSLHWQWLWVLAHGHTILSMLLALIAFSLLRIRPDALAPKLHRIGSLVTTVFMLGVCAEWLVLVGIALTTLISDPLDAFLGVFRLYREAAIVFVDFAAILAVQYWWARTEFVVLEARVVKETMTSARDFEPPSMRSGEN